MVFKCQEDSFLKRFSSKIVSCEESSLSWLPPNENTPQLIRGFNVICDDTILFPAGGGQPCDYGTINNKPVRNVVRKGTEAVHFVESSERFEEGAEVEQRLDWDRRLDHMQQHSGQHLITALFDQELNYNTTSWWLGADTSYIELDTDHLLTQKSLDFIENKGNEIIRNGCEVSVQLVDPSEAEEFQDARAPRGLPKDHVGLARVVRFEGIESNMCCGTHVTNLSQLQCFKLLYAEKTKNGVNVHFVVGQRVLRKLGEIFQRELDMNLVLKGGPAMHIDLIKKLQNNLKIATKTLQKLNKTSGENDAEKLQGTKTLPKYYTSRQVLTTDYVNAFLRIAPEQILYFFVTSDDPGNPTKSQMLLQGPPALVQKFGSTFVQLLEGNGNGRGNRFQGKVKLTSANKLAECEELLAKHFSEIEN